MKLSKSQIQAIERIKMITDHFDQDTNQYTKSISTRIEKIKYIKKAIRELQTFHTDGRSYVAFKDLAENTGKVGIEKDELKPILDLLKNCGDVIELPKGCWRSV